MAAVKEFATSRRSEWLNAPLSGSSSSPGLYATRCVPGTIEPFYTQADAHMHAQEDCFGRPLHMEVSFDPPDVGRA
jgi:hypothetical protein